MTYKLLVRPEAEFDLLQAYECHEERSQGLGSEFLRTGDQDELAQTLLNALYRKVRPSYVLCS